jgi:hypothetical protein
MSESGIVDINIVKAALANMLNDLSDRIYKAPATIKVTTYTDDLLGEKYVKQVEEAVEKIERQCREYRQVLAVYNQLQDVGEKAVLLISKIYDFKNDTTRVGGSHI